MTSTHTQREAKTFAQLFEDAEDAAAAEAANDNDLAFEREYNDWIDDQIAKCNRGEKAQARGYIVELQATMSFDQFCEELEKVYRGEEALVRLQPLSAANIKRKGCRVYSLLPPDERLAHSKSAAKGKVNGPEPPAAVSFNNVKETALDYLQQDWQVMRLPPRSKEPYTDKSFAAYTITNDNVGTLNGHDNLGVIFSTKGKLKDLDLDYQTAADLAKAVGLKGAAFGRQSVIGHYLFNAPGCEAKKFELPELTKAELAKGISYPRELPLHEGKPSRMVLEIRGNDNTYTMFPPSVHPCGEKLEWIGPDRRPTATTAAELRALAGRHAVAATVLFFYPDDAPARYDVRMALTGALIRSGMPAHQVGMYVQQVARLAGDEKWKEDFAERTEKRIEGNKKTTGLTKLIEVLQLPSACLGVFHEWLNVLEEEQQPKQEPALTISAIFPIDEAKIERRKWLVPGLFMRGHVTEMVAPPGIGKSLLADQMSIMLGLNRSWAGWNPRERCRTLIINAEDDHDEQERRFAAAANVMEADQNVLKDYVFLADDPHNIVIAQFDATSKMMVATPFLEKVIKTIVENKIDIVWVDPFAETFAGDENSNNDLKWAAVQWREVARRTGAAVVLVHHTKKYASGAQAGDADASRGAGALIGIVRVIVTIFSMTKEEAELMEIEEEERRRYIRFDDAKGNYNLLTGVARWFYKETYTLKNAGKFVPGDDVGVLVPWKPPGLFEGVNIETINAFYDKVNAGILDNDGKPTGEHYTTHKTSGDDRWLGTFIQEELHCDEARGKKILKYWKDQGVLIEFEYSSPVQRKMRKGVRIEARATNDDFNQQ